MDHRHLTPQEIELLVDGEEGPDYAALAAHLEECDECRNEVESQQQLVTTLEQMPHFVPSPLFAYRVMRKVEVSEPWYVTAMASVRKFLPRSRPARIATAAIAAGVATLLTATTVWLASRVDAVAFFGAVAFERIRQAGKEAASGFAHAALGTVPDLGENKLLLAATGFFTVAALSAFGLRAVAAASRRRRT